MSLNIETARKNNDEARRLRKIEEVNAAERGLLAVLKNRVKVINQNYSKLECPMKAGSKCQAPIAFSDFDLSTLTQKLNLLVLSTGEYNCGGINSIEERGCWDKFGRFAESGSLGTDIATTNESEET
ncbi:MAG: hypothetical protein WCL07_04725 [bacterium]